MTLTNDKEVKTADSVPPQLVGEILAAIKLVRSYGSIEIYIQNNMVTQITVRNIKKTSVGLNTGY